jgi:hypothetical protein
LIIDAITGKTTSVIPKTTVNFKKETSKEPEKPILSSKNEDTFVSNPEEIVESKFEPGSDI